ncbi:MAG: hypothetical protein K9K93_06650, partial [Acholeplasmataceae bacterium]|nr:hypothetical protein [Acholeplasmataceae bacterium]
MNITYDKRLTSYGSIDYVTIENNHGLTVTFTSLGAAIHRIIFHGQDLAVTPYDLEDFLSSKNYYGKTVGRTAGRLFAPNYQIDGITYPVEPFGAPQSKLHGGPKGFSFKAFDMLDPVINEESIDLTFRYLSQDGEEDFPGEVSLDVTYRVSQNNTIHLIHEATTTKTTLVNITNHVYFNLDIPNKILDHTLMIDADHLVDINPDHSVRGRLPVAMT